VLPAPGMGGIAEMLDEILTNPQSSDADSNFLVTDARL
jgi:hypothetical protein